MIDTHVTMSTLRQRLGALVNRAAYGQERIILLSHGEPRAAIVGLADLKRLQTIDAASATAAQPEQALAAAEAVRERIRAWQEAHGVVDGDVVADLKQLREKRDDSLR